MGRLLRSTGFTPKKNFASGLVALEGKVVEHEKGYRAERARVLSLVVLNNGVMTIVDDETDVRAAFVDPWNDAIQPTLVHPTPDHAYMARTIVNELKKREGRQNTWI
jgi:hypothetical protein